MAEEETEESQSSKIVEEEKTEKKGKIKKAPPRRRKTKREKESPVVKALKLVVESGEVSFGYKNALKGVKEGKPKLVVLSKNIPDLHSNEINYFSSKSNVPVYIFEGSSKDLASVCGKPFLVSALSIYNEGTSNILKLIEK